MITYLTLKFDFYSKHYRFKLYFFARLGVCPSEINLSEIE